MKNKLITISISILLILIVANTGCIEEKNSDGKPEPEENYPPTIELIWPKNPSSDFHSTHISIIWNASDPDGDELNITIYYRDRSEWILIIENETNDGEYIWNVGLTGMNTSIKITAYDGVHWAEDMSEAFHIFNFPKDGPDYIEIISPNGGENWSGVQNITWKSDFNELGNVEIKLYDGYLRTEYLIANIAKIYNHSRSNKTGEFNFYYEMNTTRYNNSNKYIIDILVSTNWYDRSDNHFTIYNKNNGTRYNRN
jgi:hypothetical protein